MSRLPWWYRSLFRLFPPAFRREAGPGVVAWADAASRVASRGGPPGQVRLHLVLLRDLVQSLPLEWWHSLTHRQVSHHAPRSSTMETTWQDVRYALRSLGRAPLVTLVAACTIAIGVAATTTMFSVANALLLRTPAGVRDADRLVTLHRVAEDGSSFHAFGYDDLVTLDRTASGLAGIAGYTMFPASLRTEGTPHLEAGMLVSANYFDVLGTRPLLGRFFRADEEPPGGPPVAVLSEPFWRRQFGGDAAILGRTITVNGQPLTIIGVAEPGFRGQFAAVDVAVWSPLGMDPLVNHRDLFTSGRSIWLEAMGRLRPGATIPQARDALSPVLATLGRADGLNYDQAVDIRRYFPVPAPAALPVGGFLGLLTVLAGLVLLIASANVGNILVARAAGRSREIAVRLALGARRIRVVRQLLTESLLLFLAGGNGGALLAFAATAALARVEPPVPVPLALDFHLDLRVLAAALVITLMAGLLFGLAPALHGTRSNLALVLRDGAAGRGNRTRLRSVLVAGQVAATVFLLVIAGLFARALGHAAKIDTGFDARGVYAVELVTKVRGYSTAQFRALADRLEQETAALPGVSHVASTDMLPLNMSNQQTQVAVPERPPEPNVGLFQTDFTTISPDYLATMGMSLRAGRSFTAADREGGPPVLLINATLAQQLWPGESAVGRRLRFGSADGDLAEVVGVVEDAMYRQLGEAPIPMTYVPRAQQEPRDLTLLVRMSPGAAFPSRQLHAILADLDRELPVSGEGPLAGFTAIALLPGRIAFGIGTGAGLTGLILAVVGLYGLLAYRVQLRRKEIGIRVALGATTRAVRRLVIGDGLRVTAIGVAVGLLLAGVASRLLGSLLFGVRPLDLVVYGGIALVLALCAWLAALVPTRRALSLQPVEVLRNE